MNAAIDCLERLKHLGYLSGSSHAYESLIVHSLECLAAVTEKWNMAAMVSKIEVWTGPPAQGYAKL